jgi:hypothetical protein
MLKRRGKLDICQTVLARTAGIDAENAQETTTAALVGPTTSRCSQAVAQCTMKTYKAVLPYADSLEKKLQRKTGTELLAASIV